MPLGYGNHTPLTLAKRQRTIHFVAAQSATGIAVPMF